MGKFELCEFHITDKGYTQGRWTKTEIRSFGLTRAPIILLARVAWAGSLKHARRRAQSRLSNQANEVVLLELSSDRPTELRSLASVPDGHTNVS